MQHSRCATNCSEWDPIKILFISSTDILMKLEASNPQILINSHNKTKATLNIENLGLGKIHSLCYCRHMLGGVGWKKDGTLLCRTSAAFIPCPSNFKKNLNDDFRETRCWVIHMTVGNTLNVQQKDSFIKVWQTATLSRFFSVIVS
ncbi:hypothetical protein CIPAW_16G028200 [Carya illinoinensis]|uniref:Uncharacterized protein n=1 Tax=Carya illinoinensis TaxID=32201 RepID=A0A8T1N1N2_CARIL|nr:hypothetical protein CIPAW_16G028200 [Carya illinoinensis]